MGALRRVLLAGSQSRWLREQATRRRFVRRAVERFMPGERLEDALAAAAVLAPRGIAAVLTRLGENVDREAEADEVRAHYEGALDRIAQDGAPCEVSLKLTQLGLDLDRERCLQRVLALAERAHARGIFLWIDMEQSGYVDATLEVCRRARAATPGVGVCLQSYLRRTPADLAALLPTGAGVRLVKGAYMEAPEVAWPAKVDVDRAYFELAQTLLGDEARKAGVRAVFGTHDPRLIASIREHAGGRALPPSACEFHLLYGIQRQEQERLAAEGAAVRVLISYGSYWFPWYMRRLAERPANVLFVARSLFRR
ncbi:MAG TPA: proline dehydrogenase family protein [Vicinamibacteria bacterium]|nr:proline dehydrogenase family protein [Vicinamibacteria bacterium]